MRLRNRKHRINFERILCNLSLIHLTDLCNKIIVIIKTGITCEVTDSTNTLLPIRSLDQILIRHLLIFQNIPIRSRIRIFPAKSLHGIVCKSLLLIQLLTSDVRDTVIGIIRFFCQLLPLTFWEISADSLITIHTHRITQIGIGRVTKVITSNIVHWGQIVCK